MADRRRIERVNGLLREEISNLIASQVNDPRLKGLITITQVQTASDLRNARVYVSVMGDESIREEALAGIQSSASYLRRELRGRVALRYVPFLRFMLDDAMLEADRLMHIIDNLDSAGISGSEASAQGS
ncbi:MAG: 30S ribosome-binding factor RbfA [Chloroflexi bacterium]|nr:30S ribosome-binding factor RbfA [Chloroflexota bacterium]MYD47419.1 30S ribosome-binding factor RbfA [Chloroflexota bacterium]